MTTKDLGSIAEWLALLGPRGCALSSSAPSSSKPASLAWKPSDLAAALAKVHPAWLGDCLLWVYAEQGTTTRLLLHLEQAFGEESYESLESVRLPTQTRRELLSLALWEARARFDCPSCSGRGTVQKTGVVSSCAECKGSGCSTRFSKRQRAQFYGVSPATWNSRFETPYQHVVRWLHGRIGEGLTELRKQVK